MYWNDFDVISGPSDTKFIVTHFNMDLQIILINWIA